MTEEEKIKAVTEYINFLSRLCSEKTFTAVRIKQHSGNIVFGVLPGYEEIEITTRDIIFPMKPDSININSFRTCFIFDWR